MEKFDTDARDASRGCPRSRQVVQTLDPRPGGTWSRDAGNGPIRMARDVRSRALCGCAGETSLIHPQAEKVVPFSAKKPLTVRMNGGRYKSSPRLTSVGATMKPARKNRSIQHSHERADLHLSPVILGVPVSSRWAGDLLALADIRILRASPPPGDAVSSIQELTGRSA